MPSPGPRAADLERCALHEEMVLGDLGDRLRELSRRLVTVMDQSDRIMATAEIVASGLIDPRIDDPTDNLILAHVLRHARRHSPEPKAFISSNSHDFGQPGVQSVMKEAGVRYVRRASAAVAWPRSQPSAESNAGW